MEKLSLIVAVDQADIRGVRTASLLMNTVGIGVEWCLIQQGQQADSGPMVRHGPTLWPEMAFAWGQYKFTLIASDGLNINNPI